MTILLLRDDFQVTALFSMLCSCSGPRETWRQTRYWTTKSFRAPKYLKYEFVKNSNLKLSISYKSWRYFSVDSFRRQKMNSVVFGRKTEPKNDISWKNRFQGQWHWKEELLEIRTELLKSLSVRVEPWLICQMRNRWKSKKKLFRTGKRDF